MVSSDLFDEVWEREAPAISRGEGFVDIADGAGVRPSPPIVTLVSRLPSDTARRLAVDAQNIAREVPGHYIYPEADLHVTTLFVGNFLFSSGLPTCTRSEMHDVIREEIAATPPLKFVVRGLGLFRSTIFAQMHDVHGDRMLGLRSRLHARLSATTGRAATPLPSAHLVFANLIRFLHRPEPRLPAILEGFRHTEYGLVTLEEIQLVETDKFLSHGATTVLNTYSLLGTAFGV